MDRDVDELLRRNAEQQLADFDRDCQRRKVIQRLQAGCVMKPRRIIAIRLAAGAAAVLVVAAGYVGVGLFHARDQGAGGPAQPPAAKESAESDPLLASTDPTTILLTGPMRLLVSNDPTLAPHSVWEQ